MFKRLLSLCHMDCCRLQMHFTHNLFHYTYFNLFSCMVFEDPDSTLQHPHTRPLTHTLTLTQSYTHPHTHIQMIVMNDCCFRMNEWMIVVFGHDSALLRLYWAGDNLAEWDEFCYESHTHTHTPSHRHTHTIVSTRKLLEEVARGNTPVLIQTPARGLKQQTVSFIDLPGLVLHFGKSSTVTKAIVVSSCITQALLHTAVLVAGWPRL